MTIILFATASQLLGISWVQHLGRLILPYSAIKPLQKIRARQCDSLHRLQVWLLKPAINIPFQSLDDIG